MKERGEKKELVGQKRKVTREERICTKEERKVKEKIEECNRRGII